VNAAAVGYVAAFFHAMIPLNLKTIRKTPETHGQNSWLMLIEFDNGQLL